jgi:hypothetical protein
MSTFLVIIAGLATFILIVCFVYNYSKKVESFIDKKLILLFLLFFAKTPNFLLKRDEKKRKKRESEFKKRMGKLN